MNDFNAANTKDLRRAAKLAKQAEAERRVVVYNLMSNPAGRSWMYDRLVRCHMFTTSFSTAALSMAFAEGERNVGLQDLNDIMAFAPDQYIQMMREQNDKEIANDRHDSGHRRSDSDDGRVDSGRTDDADGSGVESEYEPGPDV